MQLSEHQMTACWKCAEDPSRYNHCAWCGGEFGTVEQLIEHMDSEGCGAKIEEQVREAFKGGWR